ncbi:hypothetical protein RclHR1_02300001 [Rhizophagus clarus]|uniref:Uncharacterized protein n=1 Tax=Rhizophagus clarus TaxID=94130 RepID=A0A2Z6QW12_9GLOM|nr:hypothetical protein RclHR1_02300001 [Rhizophagus clarus]GES78889.1 hypothetical protein GLOIN_2v1555084 [Rhizophagus clarus]
MMTTERSTSIAKSCLVLVEFLAMNYIKYIDFALDEEQKERFSSEKGPIKTILANASKKIQPPVRNEKNHVVTPTQNTPIVSAEILKKSEAVRKSTPTNSVNKESDASPSFSLLAELSLRKAEKEQLPLEQRHKSLIPSSLGGNRPSNWKSTNFYPSKRYSTPASDKPKRTTTMKLMNSTAANRTLKNKRRVQESDDEDDVVRSKSKQKSRKQTRPQLKEINLNLFDERPLLSQRPRTYHLSKSPEMNLQIARRYLKAMVKVRKHRNTI